MAENSEIELLLNKNLVIVQELKKKATMFGNGMLILSFFDCLFGILAIFYSTLAITAFIASATSLTAITICGKVIQVSKIRQLEKSLKTLNFVSLAWFADKYAKYLQKNRGKIKMTKSTALQKVLSTILAVFGVGGVVVMFMPQFTSMAQTISTYVAMASEIIATASGIWLSGTSDKVLSEEEVKEIQCKKNEKVALATAQAELKAKQKQELDNLAAMKLAELNSKKDETK